MLRLEYYNKKHQTIVLLIADGYSITTQKNSPNLRVVYHEYLFDIPKTDVVEIDVDY